jgi:hypothetical protein
VPVSNPTEVYGDWPYPSYPPVYIPPAPAAQAQEEDYLSELSCARSVVLAPWRVRKRKK